MAAQNPYKWEVRHFQLRDALAYLVPFPQPAASYARVAGVDVRRINWMMTPYDMWGAVIDEAIKIHKVDDLVRAVSKDYPKDPFLLAAIAAEPINYSPGPTVGEEIPWQPVDQQTLEALTQKDVNTLLPICFLEKGLSKARSVAKVQYRVPAGMVNGSGFLTDDNLFITNNHVIPDKDVASRTTILFNFEDDADGNPKAADPFYPDPEKMATSAGLDTTVIRLKADANSKYGALPLKAPFVPLAKDQFVNIIQHPAGQPKKIALYHNIVTTAQNVIVQYLTDTLQGSSGSPVFNSDWDVVALHHSGGHPVELVDKKFLCQNEGINILRIIEFINDERNRGTI